MDELNPKLRSLLDAAREADDPGEGDARRVRAAIAATLAQTPSSGKPPTAPSSAGTALWKWLGIGVVASGLIAAGMAMQHRAPPPASTIEPAPSATTAFVSGPEPARIVSPAAEPVVASELARPEEPAPKPAPLAARNAPRVHQPRHAAKPAPEPAAGTGPSELVLIRSATSALRDADGRAAMRLLDQHAQLYPEGMLEQERRGLRVLALCALGETSRALRERERFLHTAPHSPLAGRVKAACGEPERRP